MPLSSTSRTAREAELKYNVVTEYPDFHLHSAAAKGNLALVHYALSQGQPVNSVLEGLLPLHAAASNGSEPVVSRLLEAGADVNAPRLPLRYNNEKGKNGSVIVGTAGCTPLHFAAANGHLPIVRLLLNRGADPRIGDKHGVRPEDVAADYGYHAIVDVLREAGNGPTSALPQPIQPTSSPRCRILKVQRSIGDSLAARRPSLSSLGGSSSRKVPSDPATEPPFIDQPSPQTANVILYQPGRRPSLPTLLRNPPASRSGAFRRPSSAGEGVDRGRNTMSSARAHHAATIPEMSSVGRAVHQETIAIMHKATSKYSLSNIFKKTADMPLFEEGSSGLAEVNPGRARTLDEVLTAPAPPADPVWYQARKSSEVIVPSPLALGATMAREASPDGTPSASRLDSLNHVRSTSAPDTKVSNNLSPRQPRQFVPVTVKTAPSDQLIRPNKNTQADGTEPATLATVGPETASQAPFSPVLPRSVSDPIRVKATLLSPPPAHPARTRGDSLSSNSEALSNVEGGSWGIALTDNTTPTSPSPHDRLSTSSTAPRFTICKGVPISLQSVSSRVEAQALVEKTRQNILASALMAPSLSAAPGATSLAEQLEVYGRTLQLEKHFARGEAQKTRIGEPPRYSEADSDDADGDEKRTRSPMSPGSSSPDFTASPLGLSFTGSSGRRPIARLAKSYLTQSSSASLAGSHIDRRPVSPSTSASSPRPRRHKPIANMSYLQHKHSLEARLNRQYGTGGMDLDEEDGVDDEDEFGVVRQPDPKRRSSKIEIIHTLPTPTESPASVTSVFGSAEPVFKEEEGSPIYQSPLANANAPPADRPRAPVSKPNPFIPEYILPSENAFPPRSHITARPDTSHPSTTHKPSNVRRPSTAESAKSFPVVRAVSPPPRRSEDVSSLPPNGSNSIRRFGLRNLVHTLTKR